MYSAHWSFWHSGIWFYKKISTFNFGAIVFDDSLLWIRPYVPAWLNNVGSKNTILYLSKKILSIESTKVKKVFSILRKINFFSFTTKQDKLSPGFLASKNLWHENKLQIKQRFEHCFFGTLGDWFVQSKIKKRFGLNKGKVGIISPRLRGASNIFSLMVCHP